MTKEEALRRLASYGYPLGSEGAASLAYWNDLDFYLRTYILTWDDLISNGVDHGKAVWENGTKKRGYTFTRPYRRPDPPPMFSGKLKENVVVSKEKPRSKSRVRIFSRSRKHMADETLGPRPPADEATQELWDANKKLIFAEETENMRRNRTFFDSAIGRSQDFNAQLNQLALQAMQNAIETANLVGKNALGEANLVNKQAVAHRDIAIAQQWRDQGRDNYPADEQFDLGNADDETD